MMLNDLQKRAIDAANRFCDEHFSEENMRIWVKTRGLPSDLYNSFYSDELCSRYLVSCLDGREPVTALERATFMEQITRRAGATLPIISDMMSLGVLSVIEVSDQIRDLLRADELEYGRPSFSFAFTEHGLFGNVGAITTSVSQIDGSMVLRGRKEFVASGRFLPATFVIAKDDFDNGDLSLWFVPTGAQGVSAFPMQSLGLEMVDPAELLFDDVVLEESWRIAMDSHKFSDLQSQCRFVLCSACLGLAEAAYDAASELMEKRADRALAFFGKSNGELMAEMHAKILSMKLMVYYLAQCSDDCGIDAMLAAESKMYVCQAAYEVAESAMSIAGYDGYSSEAKIARIWKDIMGMRIALGSEGTTASLVSSMLKRGVRSEACAL